MKATRIFAMFFALSLAALGRAESGVGAPAAAPTEKKEPGSEATELPVPKLDPGEERAKAAQKTYSGVVNVLRQGERVEVVFKTGEIFSLPRGSRQQAIFKALDESEKTGTAVSIVVDDRTGIIQSVGGAPAKGSSEKQK